MGQFPSKPTNNKTKCKLTPKKLRKMIFKKSRKVKRKSSTVGNRRNEQAANKFSFQNDDDVVARRRMQDQLAFDSDIFALNQMMLSVQFFGNFERDLREAIELNSRRENEKSKCLRKHCKAVMFPDRLAEAVDRRVKYVEKHGKMKNKLQTLQTQALYIVHENIEIINPGDTSVYSIADDAPLYKFQIDNPYEGARRKKIIHHAGYVKLKSSDKINKNDILIYNSSSDSQYVSGSLKNETEDDGTYGDNEEEIEDEKNSRESLTYARNAVFENKVGYYAASMNSLTPSSSEYDYTYIKALNTLRPLNVIAENDRELSTVMLPDSCLTTVSRFMVHNKQQDQFYRISTEDDEDDSLSLDDKISGSEKSDPKGTYYYEDKQYLNSKGFLSHFIHLFQQKLAKELEIPENILKTATWKGCSVFCEPWEIIPSISCPWPREANEWIYRKREIRLDPVTNLPFQWPSLEMIEKITNFGCHIIPMGYAPKVGSNPQRELEWKIVFPEAERFLESRLSIAQIKIFMITKALFKAFIEPDTERGINMFTIEHIRNHLFWQCEFNYLAWNEGLLGEGLLKFLTSLLHSIKTHKLPDYFIPKRNLLENIPEKFLVHLHKKIYRIIENPVPYVLIAIRNLRYQRNFYPKLKCKRLYSRLLVDDPLKLLIPCNQTRTRDFMAPVSDDDERSEISLGTIAYYEQKERKSRRNRARCVRFALDDQYVAAYSRKKVTEVKERKASIESIDTKIVFLKHMEVVRRKLIYEFFIEQFLEMTKLSVVKYQDYPQSLVLLRQTERLCFLLADDTYQDEAEDYMKSIVELRESIARSKTDNLNGPELPRRVSLANHKVEATDDVPSDDDNDEIYSYHQSVIAQIHATNTENLARFEYSEDIEDDVESINKSCGSIALNDVPTL